MKISEMINRSFENVKEINAVATTSCKVDSTNAEKCTTSIPIVAKDVIDVVKGIPVDAAYDEVKDFYAFVENITEEQKAMLIEELNKHSIDINGIRKMSALCKMVSNIIDNVIGTDTSSTAKATNADNGKNYKQDSAKKDFDMSIFEKSYKLSKEEMSRNQKELEALAASPSFKRFDEVARDKMCISLERTNKDMLRVMCDGLAIFFIVRQKNRFQVSETENLESVVSLIKTMIA